MKRPKTVKRAGPYIVQSCADGTMVVTPNWPMFRKFDPDEGGGPGLGSRLGLAADLQDWLNGGPASLPDKGTEGVQKGQPAPPTRSEADEL